MEEDSTVFVLLISILSAFLIGLVQVDTLKLIKKYKVSLDNFTLGKVWYGTGFIHIILVIGIAIFAGINLIRRERE